jgi:hypothetical protein
MPPAKKLATDQRQAMAVLGTVKLTQVVKRVHKVLIGSYQPKQHCDSAHYTVS